MATEKNKIITTGLVNNLIKDYKNNDDINIKDISDGYHTFGELYEHRIELYIALCKSLFSNWQKRTHIETNNPIWCSKLHSDGTMFDGMFVLGINTEKDIQITYHLDLEYWDRVVDFAWEYDKAPEYDGHTSQDVLERLRNSFNDK